MDAVANPSNTSGFWLLCSCINHTRTCNGSSCSGSLNRATVVVHLPSCFLSHCLIVSPQHPLCRPPPLLRPSFAPPCSTGQIGKLRWQRRSGGRSYLSQTDQEVCDGGVDGCCRSVTLAGARQTGPHGSGTVGLQTDGTWWVTNN